MPVSKVDNTATVISALREATREALANMGALVRVAAQDICPVDTGKLRDSIEYEVEGDSVYIGSNAEYSKYVELGTSRQDAQPYLKPAAVNNTDKLMALASAEYHKVIQR